MSLGKLHKKKIRELSKNFAKAIEEEAIRLANSGGVDLSEYNYDNYVLAKILITAAIENKKDNYAPFFYKPYSDVVKNLKHF